MYNVLIVDDESLIREGIADGIDWISLGCEAPFAAENGLEAVEVIMSGKIDIVITDIKMPGMNGLDLAKWIHENYNHIKVIILTGYDDFKFAQSALKFGVVDFILKPTKLEEIEKSIRDIKKKLVEENEKQQLLEESKVIKNKSKVYEAGKFVSSIIFGHLTTQDFGLGNGIPDFVTCIQRIAVLEFKDSADKKIDEGITCYIDHIEKQITSKLFDSKIWFLTLPERERLIVFFFSGNKDIDKSFFDTVTEKIVHDIESDINSFMPFDLSIGLSFSDESIYNAKKMYYDALNKSDMDKARKSWLENLNAPGDIIVDRALGQSFSNYIQNRDVQGIFNEIDAFFKSIKLKSITSIKSAAIELINYTIDIINKSYVTKGISKEKVYSSIINSFDIAEIEHVVKETIRKIYINTDVFQDEVESSDLDDKVIAYIKANFFNDLTLEEVADKFYISAGHLSRILKKNCGKTFLDLLTQIRVENAKILLRNPRLKAYEVANAVGFKDPKYFSQVFKKYTGKTPSDYK